MVEASNNHTYKLLIYVVRNHRRRGIRGTQVEPSIQDIVDEVAPIKEAPYGVEGRFIQKWCH